MLRPSPVLDLEEVQAEGGGMASALVLLLVWGVLLVTVSTVRLPGLCDRLESFEERDWLTGSCKSFTL